MNATEYINSCKQDTWKMSELSYIRYIRTDCIVLYVYIHIYDTPIPIHSYTYMYTRTQYTYLYIHTYFVYIHTHTYIHTYIYIYIQYTYGIHTYMHKFSLYCYCNPHHSYMMRTAAASLRPRVPYMMSKMPFPVRYPPTLCQPLTSTHHPADTRRKLYVTHLGNAGTWLARINVQLAAVGVSTDATHNRVLQQFPLRFHATENPL